MKKIIALLLLVPYLGLSDEALTRDERICALTLLGEARGEGEIGMFAVACVIQRRALKRGLKPAEVCLEPDQFEVWTGKKERDLWPLWKSKRAMYARHLARHLNNKNTVLVDIVNGANHYCHIRFNPYWAKDKKPVIIIGSHKFYKL